MALTHKKRIRLMEEGSVAARQIDIVEYHGNVVCPYADGNHEEETAWWHSGFYAVLAARSIAWVHRIKYNTSIYHQDRN